MAATFLIVRSITLLSSVLLILLGITAIYTSCDASRRLARDFPPDRYVVWYGPLNADWREGGMNMGEKLVRLDYDWSSENFVWVAAGFSIVVGFLSVIVEAVRLWRHRAIRKGNNAAITSTALSFTSITLPTVAFVVSLIALIFVNVKHHKLGTTMCDWDADISDDYMLHAPGHDSYTCTREIAACKITNNFGVENAEMGDASCVELKISRNTMIPLTIFSGVVALGYGAQVWLNKRGQNGGVNAEERVRRLQEEEEE